MVKIIMHGCNGAMGQVITKLAAEDKDAEITAGIDRVDTERIHIRYLHLVMHVMWKRM